MLKRFSNRLVLMIIYILTLATPVFAETLTYSGGGLLSDHVTENPTLIGRLQYLGGVLPGNSTQVEKSAGWSEYTESSRDYLAYKVPANKTVRPENLWIKYDQGPYDVKVTIKEITNNYGVDRDIQVEKYNYGWINFSRSSTRQDGFYITFHVDIFEKGTTSSPTYLDNVYLYVADIDGAQSFKNISTPFAKSNMFINSKVEFDEDEFGQTRYKNMFNPETGVIYSANKPVSQGGGNSDVFNSDGKANIYQRVGKAVKIGEDIVFGFNQGAGSAVQFYSLKRTVEYKSDPYGTITGPTSETRLSGEEIKGSAQKPNDGYTFGHWISNRDLVTKDGNTIAANTPISDADIKKIRLTEDEVILTAIHRENTYSVNYEWDGDHPDLAVPEGKDGLKKKDIYSVDTTFTPNKEFDGTHKGKPGTWVFDGWDNNGDIVISGNLVIKGKWHFVNKFKIETKAINGNITEPETGIPEGENRVITYTPNEGYQLKSLTVNGQAADLKEHPFSYPFEKISNNHTVKVEFEKIPALEAIKTSDKSVYNAGDEVTYTIKIKQAVENAESRKVKIADTLPEGVTLTKGSIKGDGISVVKEEDNLYELSVERITSELTYTYTAVTADGKDSEELLNVVSITSSNTPNPAEASNTVQAKTPKPEISKIVSNENPLHNEEITYTISVKEPQDGIVVRNAVVTDTLSDGLEYAGHELIGNGGEVSVEGNTITANIPVLDTESVISVKAGVSATEGNINNIAVLTGDKIEELRDNAEITVKAPETDATKVDEKEQILVTEPPDNSDTDDAEAVDTAGDYAAEAAKSGSKTEEPVAVVKTSDGNGRIILWLGLIFASAIGVFNIEKKRSGCVERR